MSDAPKRPLPHEIESAKRMMQTLAVDHVPGAMKKGTRIEKTATEAKNGHADGAGGRVLGVMPIAIDNEFAYFVEWDDLPGVPIFTRGSRLRELEEPEA